LFAAAKGVEAFAVTDIVQRMWEKLVHLSTAAAMTCLMRANVGDLAWEMVSNAFGVGQAIGVTLATISLPIITIIWPGPYPSIFDAGFGIGSVISAELFRF
jgi:hypothetical protein